MPIIVWSHVRLKLMEWSRDSHCYPLHSVDRGYGGLFVDDGVNSVYGGIDRGGRLGNQPGIQKHSRWKARAIVALTSTTSGS